MISINNSKKQPRGKPFPAGVTGNPNGRPPKTEQERALEAACKEKMPEALDKVLEIMHTSEREALQLQAAIWILERGHGKARQAVEHIGSLTTADVAATLTREQLEGAAKAMLMQSGYEFEDLERIKPPTIEVATLRIEPSPFDQKVDLTKVSWD